MSRVLFNVMLGMHRLVRGVANRVLDEKLIRPRSYSNKLLREYAPYFSGSVLNVSGWKDADGEGGCYRTYFKNVSTYVVSNVAGQEKGFGSASNYCEIELDLEQDLEDDLRGKFDVVFNHTTLEHV